MNIKVARCRDGLLLWACTEAEFTRISSSQELRGVEFESVPVVAAGKKNVIRFAAGEPGFRGTVWRLWGQKGSDDFYLASRESVKDWKFSFHRSGKWRFALNDLTLPQGTILFPALAEGADRAVHKWERPQADAAGHTEAFCIFLPHGNAARVADDAERLKGIQWFDLPSQGEYTIFQVLTIAPDQGARIIRQDANTANRTSVIGALRLSSGTVVAVIGEISELSAEYDEEIRRIADDGDIQRCALEITARQPWERGTRILKQVSLGDGLGFVIDFSPGGIIR